MNLKFFVQRLVFGSLVGFNFVVGAGQQGTNDFAATTDPVGRMANGLETPVNQRVTPAGTLIELRGLRPSALALSPDRHLLVTSGLTRDLVVLDPATGKISQRIAFPAGSIQDEASAVPGVLDPGEKAQISFTGLVFSPDGSRIYLANVNGDIKVFSVDKDHKVAALFSIPLLPTGLPGHTNDIPAGIAVSPDGKRLYVALNLSNRLAESMPRPAGCCGSGTSGWRLWCHARRQKGLREQLGRTAARPGQRHRPGRARHPGARGPGPLHRQRRLGVGD